MEAYFIPLRKLLPGWINDVLEAEDESLLDKVGVVDLRITPGYLYVRISGQVIFAENLSFHVGAVSGLSVSVLAEGGVTSVGFDALVATDHYCVRLFDANVSLRFEPNLLRPVRQVGSKFEIDTDTPFVSVDVEGTFGVSSDGGLFVEGAPALSLPAFMVGETGIVLEASAIQFVFREQDFADLPDTIPQDWRGLYVKHAVMHLPAEFSDILPEDVLLEDFFIGSGGFCGRITGNWTPQLNPDGTAFTGDGAGEIFGIPFGIKSISMEFKQNTLVESSIQGTMILPFFEGPVDVNICLANDGDFTVGLLSATEGGLVTLTKDDLLELKLENIAFEKEGGVFSIQMGGTITPLFGGLPWPSFEIEALTIDSRGKVSIAGGWIDLPQKKTLDFHGFALEISKLGFGTEDDGTRWIGFSGGLKLCEGLPMSGAVEGLRVNWKGSDVWLEFSGAEVAFEIPDAIEFKGRVAFIEDPKEPKDPSLPKTRGFKGGGKLKVIPTGLEIDAQLVIGKNDADPSYTFFYIFVDTQLPAGIPLGNSGVAFYGFGGLFGYNMVPNRRADQPWF